MADRQTTQEAQAGPRSGCSQQGWENCWPQLSINSSRTLWRTPRPTPSHTHTHAVEEEEPQASPERSPISLTPGSMSEFENLCRDKKDSSGWHVDVSWLSRYPRVFKVAVSDTVDTSWVAGENENLESRGQNELRAQVLSVHPGWYLKGAQNRPAAKLGRFRQTISCLLNAFLCRYGRARPIGREPGQTWCTLGGLHILSGFGTPWDPQGRAGGCGEWFSGFPY